MNIEQLAGQSIYSTASHGFNNETIQKIKDEKKNGVYELLKKCLILIVNLPKEFITSEHCKIFKYMKNPKGIDIVIVTQAYKILFNSGKFLEGTINEKVKLISNDDDYIMINKRILKYHLEFFCALFRNGMKESNKTEEGIYEIKCDISKSQLENLRRLLYAGRINVNSISELIDLYWVVDHYNAGTHSPIKDNLMYFFEHYYLSCDSSVTYQSLKDVIEDFYTKKFAFSKLATQNSLKNIDNKADDTIKSKGKEKETEKEQDFPKIESFFDGNITEIKDIEESLFVKTELEKFEIKFLNLFIGKVCNGIYLHKESPKGMFRDGLIPISQFHLLQDKGIIGTLLNKHIKGVYLDCPNKLNVLNVIQFMKETGQIEEEFFEKVSNLVIPADLLNENRTSYVDKLFEIVSLLFPNLNNLYLNFNYILGSYTLKSLKKLKGGNELLSVTLSSTPLPITQYQYTNPTQPLQIAEDKSYFYVVGLEMKDCEWLDLKVDYNSFFLMNSYFNFTAYFTDMTDATSVNVFKHVSFDGVRIQYQGKTLYGINEKKEEVRK